jgi:NADH-quinone oxidoreductase subunit G
MPKIIIDGREVEFRDGQTVLQACEAAGTAIPHFCYHPKLSIAGNCRMCLVEIEKAPTLQISCYTPAREGMVIHTQNEKVKKARKGVLEFLLINHPLDCPICDQAGECPLQQNTMNWGPDRSRFEEEKERFGKRVEMGPHVMFDAERCIKCTRCVRFCDEVTHTGELGLVERSDRAVIDVFPGKKLDNAYSLCTVDICPVGALTSREFRFENRVWFMGQAKSVCAECSRGCSMTVWTNMQGEVQRMTPSRNDNVNGTWMCDAGRLSYMEWKPEARLRRAALRNGRLSEKPLDEALKAAASALRSARERHGAFAAAAWCSAFATNEEMFLLKKLAGRVELLSSPQGASDDILVRKDKSPNRRGAQAILGSENLSADIRSGKIKALVAFKPSRAAELPLGPAELAKLDVLVVLDWQAGPLSEMATHLLPCAAPIEDEGSFTNEFGWVQRIAPARPAPGEAMPGWKILSNLIGAGEDSAAKVFESLAQSIKAFEDMTHRKLGASGLRLASAEEPPR